MFYQFEADTQEIDNSDSLRFLMADVPGSVNDGVL